MMHKPFDITMKTLMGYDPIAWLKLFGIDPDGPVSVVNTEVSTVKSDVDKVYKIDGPDPRLIHIENQSTPGDKTIERMFRSNVLIGGDAELPVLSILNLLRPSADSELFSGEYLRTVNGFGPVTIFYYPVVRLWKLDAEAILNGPPAVLPIATLANVPDETVPNVLRRIDERMIHETDSSTASTIMVASLLLAGLRIERERIVDLMRRLASMNLLQESSFYQLLLEEGEEKGLQKGLQKGINASREMLLGIGEKLFGPPDTETRTVIESISDLERLKRMGLRALSAKGWNDLLAEK